VLDSVGFEIDKSKLNNILFDFQKDIVRWSIAKGRAAIFADCGLGKTFCQLEWANQILNEVGGKILILAPLNVVHQTVEEGVKLGVPVNACESQNDIVDGINITNYDKLDKFDTSVFCGVVLDESSILKSFTGKTRNSIIDKFEKTKYKLACTATPAPNDYMELGNHSEFLGVMTRNEMLSMFFTHDGGQTSKWRLKGHSENLFWEWMSSWAVFIDNPSNLGYDTNKYDLPELHIKEIVVDGDEPTNEQMTLVERREARKESLEARCAEAANIIKNSDEKFVVWCDLNLEQSTLSKYIENAVSIQGSTPQNKRVSMENDWKNGDVQSLITKPLCYGYGSNWQHCHNIIFTGLSDSYEKYYQALRRCWRFGQNEEVNVYIVISAKEGCVKDNINRKDNEFKIMKKNMLDYTKEITKNELKKTNRIASNYDPDVKICFPTWEEFNIECTKPVY